MRNQSVLCLLSATAADLRRSHYPRVPFGIGEHRFMRGIVVEAPIVLPLSATGGAIWGISGNNFRALRKDHSELQSRRILTLDGAFYRKMIQWPFQT